MGSPLLRRVCRKTCREECLLLAYEIRKSVQAIGRFPSLCTLSVSCKLLRMRASERVQLPPLPPICFLVYASWFSWLFLVPMSILLSLVRCADRVWVRKPGSKSEDEMDR